MAKRKATDAQPLRADSGRAYECRFSHRFEPRGSKLGFDVYKVYLGELFVGFVSNSFAADAFAGTGARKWVGCITGLYVHLRGKGIPKSIPVRCGYGRGEARPHWKLEEAFAEVVRWAESVLAKQAAPARSRSAAN